MAGATDPPSPRAPRVIAAVLLVLAAAAAAWATRDRWSPLLTASAAEPAEPHAGHSHADRGGGDLITLSPKGLKNVGFEPYTISIGRYEQTMRLPAIVVERPGRSQLHITAPLTGVVTAIDVVPGVAVDEGQKLFEMRLTHEELVLSQRDFLKTLADLRVVGRELTRLRRLSEGVVAGKRVLEQEYEEQRLEASLLAERQAMRLHGLNEEQVADIERAGKLLQYLSVRAPAHVDDADACTGEHSFMLQSLHVAKGEQVNAGDELAVLSDHCVLHVEGTAFEDDAAAIRAAANSGRSITARLVGGTGAEAEVEGLELLYASDRVDPESRALRFYLRLTNEVASRRTAQGGATYLEWRFKPGQRMEVALPVRDLEDQIIVPPAAVVDEAAEAYVYRQNGAGFERVPVHVVLRDPQAVVLANDGALFPGDVIAGRGAYQMHLALKNQSGGGVDPHAGHNH